MIVRADLYRPVAGVGDRERNTLAAFVELDLAVLNEIFAGDHQFAFRCSSFRDDLKDRARSPYPPPENMDSGLAAARRPGMAGPE